MSTAIWIVLYSAEVVHFTHTTCFALMPARGQRAYTQFLWCVSKLIWQSRYISQTQDMLHDSLPEYRGSVHLTGLATPTPTNSSSSRAAAFSRVNWLNKLGPYPLRHVWLHYNTWLESCQLPVLNRDKVDNYKTVPHRLESHLQWSHIWTLFRPISG